MPEPTDKRPGVLQKHLLHLWRRHSSRNPREKSLDPRTMVRLVFRIWVRPLHVLLDKADGTIQRMWSEQMGHKWPPVPLAMLSHALQSDIDNTRSVDLPLAHSQRPERMIRSSPTAPSPRNNAQSRHSILSCVDALLKIKEQLRTPPGGKTYGWGLIMKEGRRVPAYVEWITAALLVFVISSLPVLLGYCILTARRTGYDVFGVLGAAVGFGGLVVGLWGVL